MEPWIYFATPVYSFILNQYIETASNVADEYIEKISKEVTLNPVYPSYQSYSFDLDSKMLLLRIEIIKKCNEVLENQGYDVSNYELFFTEFWAQKHFKTSNQERHVHNNNLLTGFYFLDCPENGCKLVIHDPRPAKEFGSYLPEIDRNNPTLASQTINFTPEPGQLIIIDSFIPHSFSRNESDVPSKFIHFNVGAKYRETNII